MSRIRPHSPPSLSGNSSVVEHRLAKARVEGSNPFSRSKLFQTFFEMDLNPRSGGFPRGCAPFVGRVRGGLAPSARVSEAIFGAELTMESGQSLFPLQT